MAWPCGRILESMVYLIIFLQGHVLTPHDIFPTAKHQIPWALLSYIAKASVLLAANLDLLGVLSRTGHPHSWQPSLLFSKISEIYSHMWWMLPSVPEVFWILSFVCSPWGMKGTGILGEKVVSYSRSLNRRQKGVDVARPSIFTEFFFYCLEHMCLNKASNVVDILHHLAGLT